MTIPERARRAFAEHDAYAEAGEEYVLETGRFAARVTAAETDDDWALAYSLTVRVPVLDAVTEEDVGPAVQEGWLETFSLRIEDAPGSVRRDLDVAHSVETVGDEVVVRFSFEEGNADRAPGVAKTLAEYVEGTYMEGVVPGYSYLPPVSEMLGSARSGDGSEGGSMPM